MEIDREYPYMKASLTLLLALFVFPSLAVSSPDLSNYQLVFGDEFNDAQLNTNNWGSSHIWGPYVPINAEKQYYVDKLGGDAGHAYNPFVLNGSTLKIKAVPTTAALTAPAQPNQNEDYWSQNPEFQYNADYDPDSREYLSGILTSVNKFDFAHGYAEARIKLPEGQGLWSAFWLLTSKYVEDAPEIDIMEALGHNTNTVHHTMHYFDTSNNWQLISTPTYDTTGVDYTADFHVYGLAWSPKKITWYVDGVAVKTLTDQDFKIPTQSMYVLLNVATGGSWPGDPDSSTPFPANMEVDYVRVYEQQPVNTITPAILASDYQIMFEDNFNGTALNDQLWNTNYLWGPYYPINNEHQIYIDKHGRHSQSAIQPFSVSNGVLSIEAKTLAAEDVPDQPPVNDPEWQAYSSHQYNAGYGQPDGWTPTYSSGLITSYEKFKFLNGYVEARIKLPAGGGLWPAFWLLNGYYVGPQPEIDIIELDGAHPNVGHHSYHYFNNSGEIQSSAELSSSTTGSFTDDFHVYGVQWDAGQIKWYVDGYVVRTLQGPEVSSQLMYILLNLAVGGNFVGDVDASVFPTTMDVDYVRAYQRKDHADVVAPPPGEVTVTAPTGIVSSGSPVVEWTDDSNLSATGYRILVRDAAHAIQLNAVYPIGVLAQNGGTYSYDPQLNLGTGDYRVWVRGENALGNGVYSALSEFSVPDGVALPPGEVTIATPSGIIGSVNPIIEWGEDSNSSATSYRILVRNAAHAIQLNAVYPIGVLAQNGGTYSYDPQLNLGTGEYRVWVRGENALGNGAYSALSEFSVPDGVALPPGAVSITAPSGNIASGNPVVEWSEDSNASATSYRILVRNAAHAIKLNAVYPIGVLAQNDGTFSYDLQLNLGTGEYRVWVRGENALGNGAYSALSEFSVPDGVALPPGEVTIATPSGNISSGNPIIEWSEDSNASATSYRILVRDAAHAIQLNAVYPIGVLAQNGGTYSYAPQLNLGTGEYRVWVRGENALGNGSYSALSSFVVP